MMMICNFTPPASLLIVRWSGVDLRAHSNGGAVRGVDKKWEDGLVRTFTTESLGAIQVYGYLMAGLWLRPKPPTVEWVTGGWVNFDPPVVSNNRLASEVTGLA